MKILIIGGVAGGASAATRARRVNPKAEVTILEKGPVVSFANCGLPYHLGGEIKQREKLLVAKSELFKNRFGIEIKTNTEAIKIDRSNKIINAFNYITKQNEDFHYDKLIISTGSRLRQLPVFKDKYKNVFSLWTLNDLDLSLNYINNNSPRQALVIGAGFVGLEVAEQLVHRNINVTLIEKAPQVLSPIDIEMTSFISDELKNNNIEQHLSREVIDITTRDNLAIEARLDNDICLKTDLIFWGIGVVPESKLALEAGLTLGPTSGIATNEYQLTNDPDIYAVGDASEYFHAPSNKKIPVPLAGPANRSGRIAGEHAASGISQFSQKVQGTAIVRVFTKTAAVTGLTERHCKNMQIPYQISYVSAAHHASYYPGAKELIIKLIYAPVTGLILGAQIIGQEGVDKRIDIISTLLHFNGNVKDLAGLDLAYAPPFGSAKDPLHISAFTALNDLAKTPKLISPFSDLTNYQVVDVRTNDEREKSPLLDSIHLPIDHIDGDVRSRLSELDRERETVVVCHSGKRAHVVASILCGMGFKSVFNLTGGMLMRGRQKLNN